jgi:serine/threonine protein kinase
LQAELREADERYQLLDVVGTGGSKTIYRARDLVTDAFVAVATLSEHSDPDLCEQFFREARVNAALVHPNVIRVYDMGFLPDDRPFFSMTLMTGKSLQTTIDDQSSSLDDLRYRLELFRKICDGVAYAHSRNVIHLDLKPENIQVGNHGQVMICDWGLARVLGQEDLEGRGETTETDLDADMLTNATMTGTVKGTPGYLAPEQAAAEKKSTATDVYSLGAILFALLTGRPPVSGATTADSLRNTREGRVDLHHARHLPKRLVSVVRKALACKPEDRYESADALEAEITRYLAGQPTEVEAAGPLTRLALFFQRNRLFAGSVLAAAVVIVGLSTAFTLNLRQSRNEAVSARDRALESEDLARQEAKRAREAQALAEESDRLRRVDKRSAKRILDRALDKYRTEEARNRELDGELQALEEVLSRVAILDASFDDTLLAFDAALKQAPDDVRIWEQKAIVHLIRQEFAAAEAALLRAMMHSDSQFLQICRRFKALKPDDSDLLTPKQAVAYLRAFPREMFGVRLHAFRDLTRKFDSPEDQLVLVRGCLRLLNPNVKDLELKLTKMEPAGNHLLLRIDSAMAVLCFSEKSSLSYDSVFQGLQLTSLDLTDVPVTHVADIGSLDGLRTINLCGTRVGHFTDVLKCESLRRLIVRPGQLSEDERKVLETRLEIVERAP